VARLESREDIDVGLPAVIATRAEPKMAMRRMCQRRQVSAILDLAD
jgi:hypothetical protein